MVHSLSIADLEKGDGNSQVGLPTSPHHGERSLNTSQVSENNDEKCNTNPKSGLGTCSPSVVEAEEDSEYTNVVGWDSPNDPENPLNFPAWRKWVLISLVSAATFITGISSSMFAPGVPVLMEEFHSTNSALGSFVVTIFVLGLGTGPLIFGPLSELYGRNSVQHVATFGLLIFSIACALSTSLNMLIGMRLLQGTFGACPLTNGGGIIADMVRQEERGFAMSMFTLGSLFAPILGPIVGGFLAAAKGWRWVFWLISIMVCPKLQ
jgi:multidrug resistance protein